MVEQTGGSSRTTTVRPKIDLPRARIVRREDLTDDLWVIWLEPEAPFIFKPGQYCTLGINGIERAYSIASAPHEKYLEIFVELVPEGDLTPPLYKLPVGETLSIRPRPKGIFALDTTCKNHLMVGTVTGMAPFISMVRDHLHHEREGHRYYLLEGASYLDEFGYDRELTELANLHPDFIVYVPTVSRPGEPRNVAWQGEQGRVNTIVEKYIQKYELDREATFIYACGHPGMIEDLKAQFLPQEWRLKEERFWKQ